MARRHPGRQTRRTTDRHTSRQKHNRNPDRQTRDRARLTYGSIAKQRSSDAHGNTDKQKNIQTDIHTCRQPDQHENR